MNLFKLKHMLTVALIMATSNHAFAIVPLPGYGGKSQAMGGVGVATPLDTFVMISNPAGISFIEDRVDVGLAYIKPVDHVKFRGNFLIPHDKFTSSPDKFVPAFGIKKDYRCFSLGLAFFGRGASVNYGRPIPIFGNTKKRFEFNQAIIKPVLAWKYTENQSIAVGVNCGLGYVSQHGSENAKAFSVSPNNVTNRGFDYRLGIGYQVGWMGRFFDKVKLGVSYDSEIYTHRYLKYRGLLADHGKSNSPPILGFGVSYDVTCKLLVAFDYQIKYWTRNKSTHNRQSFTAMNGSSEGSGFGWRDEHVSRLGIAYQYNDNLTLRAGYSYIRPYIRSSQILLNVDAAILFPNQAITGGFTWAWNCHELNVAVGQAFVRHFDGDINLLLGGGRIKTATYGTMIGVFYGYKL